METSKKAQNTLVHDTLCLFVITLIAGVLLGAVYLLTKSPIETQQEKVKQEAYAAVFADAEFSYDDAIDSALESFNTGLADETILTDSGESLSDVEIAEVMRAAVGGADAGYVVTCSGKGYGGAVEIALGIDDTGTIQGIEVMDASNETPGLGQGSTNEEWNSQYIGASVGQEISVVKDGSGSIESSTINAISGATITSSAVTRAVNATLLFIASLSE